MAQVEPSRNTKKGTTRNRSRNWCFTLNNYEEKDIKKFCECKSYKEYVFQEETGENGTKHLQGLLIFVNPVSFKTVKNINERAHWEVCKNKLASINYCSKDKTRTGNIYTNINYIKSGTDELAQIDKNELMKKIQRESLYEFLEADRDQYFAKTGDWYEI